MNSSHRRIRIYVFTVPVLIILGLIITVLYVPQPSRIIIIGLDAADWGILDPLIEAGRLPNIEKIVEEGVTGKLETFELSCSPCVWTTIATGVTRDVHGIKGFTVDEEGTQPYTSRMRKVLAMWNIVSHFGKKVGIVGHWVSWPAEEVNGHMVSSYISFDPEEGQRLYFKGILRSDINLPGQTYPADLFKEIQPYIVKPEMVTHDDLDRFFNIDDWDDPDLYRDPEGPAVNQVAEAINYIMPWAYATDKTTVDVFNYLLENKGPYDLIYTYIEGTDVVCHRFWQFHDPTFLEAAMEFWGYDLSLCDKYVEYFGDTISRYYEGSDEFIGGVMAGMGPKDTLIVVSDHGFGRHWQTVGHEILPDWERQTFSGSHHHFGAIMFYGQNVQKGVRLKGPPPDLTDVLPTILNLMDLPIAQYMEGSVIADAIAPSYLKIHPAKWVRSYGIEEQFSTEVTKSPLDDVMVERMRSLGYLR